CRLARGHGEEEIHHVLDEGVHAGLAQASDEVRVPVDVLALHREPAPLRHDAQQGEGGYRHQHDDDGRIAEHGYCSTLPVSPDVSLTDTTVARGKKLNSLAEAQV